MTDLQRTVLIGWKKSWTSAASTYLVEVDDHNVWFGRLGSGGAYWEPDYLALSMAANLQTGTQLRATRMAAAVGPTGASAAIGKAVGSRILNKFQTEIKANAARYELEGRSALDHKANMEVPRSEFAAAQLVDKASRNAPAALKAMPGPKAEVELGGKTWLFISLPEAPGVDEFLAVVQP